MIDAMDRYKLLQKMAAPKAAKPQAVNPAQFGATPMHSQPKSSGDVFIKSVKPADASAKPAASTKTPNPMGAALQGFVKQVSKTDNPLFDALKKLVPATPTAQAEPARKSLATPALQQAQPIANSPFMKAAEQKVSTPERSAPLQPTSAQVNLKNKVNLFAGTAVTSTALGGLAAAVVVPAALTNPMLMNKFISLLPAQLP